SKINYRAQLGLDDRVKVTSSVIRMGNSSVTYDQKIIRIEDDGSETIACDCESTICFTDPAMTGSVPIPPAFRELYG
ncbi:MAG: thioesterase family protein, partial [Planctomycetes bacterium]|nr:thioesterase family protein [Planctomycetota bacterium]